MTTSRTERGAGGPSVSEGDERNGATSHSFIVRIWLEDPQDKAGEAWLGAITHVPSGRRHVIRRLRDIAVFIEPYLRAMAMPKGPLDGAIRRLRRLHVTRSKAEG